MAKIASRSVLLKKLNAVLWKQRLLLIGSGFLATGTLAVVVALLLSLVAQVTALPVWVKISLLVATAITAVVFLGKYVIARLFEGTIESVTARLESKYPQLKGRLIAAIQFARMERTPGYSAELMEMTEKQALRQAELVDFDGVLRLYPLWKAGRLFAAAGAIATVLVLLMPGIFSHSLEVYSHPTTRIATPLGYQVVAVPGSTQWVKYRDIDIGAAIFGDKLPKKARIHHRLVGGNWQRSEIDLHDSRGVRWFESGYPDSLTVALTLRQISRSFDYYVEAGDLRTDMQRIDVVDRPRVTGIKLSIFYPDYTALPPTVIDENNGSFSALVGSRVNMAVEANLPVRQAELIFADSSRSPLNVAGKQAETSLLVESSRSYHIRLIDQLGEENPDPIEYYITAVPDAYPSIDVLRPGFDVNLGDDMTLPLKVRLYDDFGFSSLVLKYSVVSHGRRSEEHVAVLHFSDRIKTEGEVEFNWDMSSLGLYPGDYVQYLLEVADNDKISGPKTTRSRQFAARLPSLDEIIAETEAETAARVNQTENLYRQGRELAERMKTVARKIKAQSSETQKSEWQYQKELESIADKNMELVDKIDEMARQMDKSLEKFQESATLSREIMEKLAQIQKLFEEVATPEMKEAQRKLMEALRSMDPDDLQQSMKDFEMSQEELLERLERTIALLKKLQVEQMMEAMVRKAEQLVEGQRNVNETTDTAAREQLPSLTKTEDQLRSGLEDLQMEVEELKAMAQAAKMEDSPPVQQFSEAIEQNDAGQNMENMSGALSRRRKSEAGEQGQMAHSKLSAMLDQMQQQLLAMKGGQEDEIQKAMRQAIDDANYLSQKQEELLRQAGTIDPRSIVLREMAASQQDLAGSCSGLQNRISELGKQSPFVAAELQQLVTGAIQNMELATEGFDIKKGPQAMRGQHEAMVQLNRVAMRMMESLDQQKQCNSGSNCNKNMSQLQSLCNRQNGLNQQTKECNNPGNNPDGTPKLSRDGLQRLAGEQGGIRKSLEDLNAEFGNSREILGRLDDIAREMKLVEEDLEDGQVGEQTIERQLRVYSRMLQATRSLQRKDFTEQRRATSATEQPTFVPPALPADLFDDRINLEDRLRRFLGDNYPPQYEEQIKAYFKALLQTESSGGAAGQPSPAEVP